MQFKNRAKPERRTVLGAAASRRWNGLWAGLDSSTTLGLQVRHDRLAPVGLYSTEARTRVATTQESRVRQTSVGLYAENTLQWTRWLRSVAGLRADRFDFDVTSSIAANSGRASASVVSPKLALILGRGGRPSSSSTSARVSTATTHAAPSRMLRRAKARRSIR